MVESGCKWYEDCFTCPFEDCLLDNPKPNLNKEKALELFRQGEDVKGISLRLNRSVRQVRRYVEEG